MIPVNHLLVQPLILREKNPERAIVIYLDQAHGKSGDVIRFADLNRDGFDDLFIGAPTYNPVGSDGVTRTDAGMLTIIFGGASGLPNRHGIILLPSGLQAGLQVRYIIGADPVDQMSYGLALYDVDGDGYVDIAPNAMLGDGSDNTQLNAGEIYVISGKAFLFSRLDKQICLFDVCGSNLNIKQEFSGQVLNVLCRNVMPCNLTHDGVIITQLTQPITMVPQIIKADRTPVTCRPTWYEMRGVRTEP